MVNKAVSNTGPLIHLNEINLIKCLNIFQKIYIPNEVFKELKKNKIKINSKIKIIKLKTKSKDIVFLLCNKYFLDLGESEAIALCLQERINYFLTDDLDARNVAKVYNINAHGTAGIILRAFREKVINKETAIKKVNELYTESSLFITKEIVRYIINSINKFKFNNKSPYE